MPSAAYLTPPSKPPSSTLACQTPYPGLSHHQRLHRRHHHHPHLHRVNRTHPNPVWRETRVPPQRHPFQPLHRTYHPVHQEQSIIHPKNQSLSFHNTLISCLAYADDLVLLARSKDALQAYLDIATSTASILGLEFRPDKCASYPS